MSLIGRRDFNWKHRKNKAVTKLWDILIDMLPNNNWNWQWHCNNVKNDVKLVIRKSHNVYKSTSAEDLVPDDALYFRILDWCVATGGKVNFSRTLFSECPCYLFYYLYYIFLIIKYIDSKKTLYFVFGFSTNWTMT